MEGQGQYTWVSGHEYKGHFKDGEMEGRGEFKHPSDPHKPLVGNFRRNQFEMVSVCLILLQSLMFGLRFVQQKCYVNPMDEPKMRERVVKRMEEIAMNKQNEQQEAEKNEYIDELTNTSKGLEIVNTSINQADYGRSTTQNINEDQKTIGSTGPDLDGMLQNSENITL